MGAGAQGGARGGAPVLVWGQRRVRPARVEWIAAGKKKLSTVLREAAPAPGELVRVFLCGDRPGGGSGNPEGFHRWLDDVPDGWVAGEHWLADLMAPFLSFRTEGEQPGRVEVLRAATWFGEVDPLDRWKPTDARSAMHALEAALAAVPGAEGAQVLRTPAATGRQLLQELLKPGEALPVLDGAARELIRSTSGQGRFEVFTGAETIPGLHKRDMRLAYAASTRELGCGPAIHRDYGAGRPLGDVWADHGRFTARDLTYWPGRYRVTARVPADWSHVGLLPQMGDDGRWWFPSRPGEVVEGWVGGAELQHAWSVGWTDVTVHELLAFTRWKDVGRGQGPLARWSDALVRLRERFAGDTVQDRLVRTAVRAILLHGIGALHGSPARRTVTLPGDRLKELPGDGWATGERRRLRWDGDVVVWQETTGPGSRPEMAHPELSAQVWDRTRARVARQLLTVDRDELVAVQLDALYLTGDPGWPDDGKVGRFKPEQTWPGPLPRPRSLAELQAI